MAVDKKSNHVGDHGGRYIDNDGQSKQFTYVDHDVKTKIGTGKLNADEVKSLKSEIEDSKRETIEEILALPAVSAAMHPDGIYETFVKRDREEGVTWDENVVRNSCMINDTIRYNLRNYVWKNTVKEQHWFEEMSHEDILAGEWGRLV